MFKSPLKYKIYQARRTGKKGSKKLSFFLSTNAISNAINVHNIVEVRWMFTKQRISVTAVIILALMLLGGCLNLSFKKEQPKDSKLTIQDMTGSLNVNPIQEDSYELDEKIKDEEKIDLKNHAEINNFYLKHDRQMKISSSEKEIQDMPITYKNDSTANYNCLAIGVNDNDIEMISLYSINNSNGRAVSIFFPINTIIRVDAKHTQLQDILKEKGIDNLIKITEKELDVKIANYVIIKKTGMKEFAKLIGTIYVNNKQVDLENLFTINVSSEDEEIIRTITKELTKPSRVLQIPSMIKIMWNYVDTDFTISQVWNVYKMMKNIDLTTVKKKILWGSPLMFKGEVYTIIPERDWRNVVWEMTY